MDVTIKRALVDPYVVDTVAMRFRVCDRHASRSSRRRHRANTDEDGCGGGGRVWSVGGPLDYVGRAPDVLIGCVVARASRHRGGRRRVFVADDSALCSRERRARKRLQYGYSG
ncbi:unnamed protein product [Macrosiphum euphorbiae]|uniref:Uncharacterized protein n=1 Tax=Macrosiphum euphorbiae TaxID=13131 RepID=A0AAV0WCT7_9HEMI|nr:unnamed protein product [Macrosiphum euphorbiae]